MEGKKVISKKVGLIYDEKMCEHQTNNGEDHPECPDRIRVILNKLTTSGLLQRCEILNAKEAEDKYLQLVHSKYHVDFIKTISSSQFDLSRDEIASEFTSIYFNKGSSQAAYLAAGSVLEAAEKVAKGDLDSAFAIVRPPGHHAEQNKPMGFCLFNNVAVAASYLLNERPELGVRKILIVDWDVHHGNGTQKMFYNDSRVLVFSVHRHDFGCFYPGTDDGSHTMIGEGPGEGYNINVPWEHGCCGDSDYFAVWDFVLIPVAEEFDPDIIIVSAGFDAADGDRYGDCCITPFGYSVLLRKLMDFAEGKLVLALEGGYNLQSLANSAHACVQVLLEGSPIDGSSYGYPFESTWRVIENARQNLSRYWSSLSDELPLNTSTEIAPSQAMICNKLQELNALQPKIIEETGQTTLLEENVYCPRKTVQEWIQELMKVKKVQACPLCSKDDNKMLKTRLEIGGEMLETGSSYSTDLSCPKEEGTGVQVQCSCLIDELLADAILEAVINHSKKNGRHGFIGSLGGEEIVEALMVDSMGFQLQGKSAGSILDLLTQLCSGSPSPE